MNNIEESNERREHTKLVKIKKILKKKWNLEKLKLLMLNVGKKKLKLPIQEKMCERYEIIEGKENEKWIIYVNLHNYLIFPRIIFCFNSRYYKFFIMIKY